MALSSSDDPEIQNRSSYISYLILLAMIIIHACLSSFMQQRRERRQFTFGNETAFIILVGIAVSYLIDYLSKIYNIKIQDGDVFANEFIFQFCLPLILFASGFNMKRKKFFQNSANIFKFGIFGSFLYFIILCGCNHFVLTYMPLGFKEPLQTVDILYLSAILSSSDIIIALQSLDFEQQTKLYSVMLGEGLLNDGISILLFGTVSKMEYRVLDFDGNFTWSSPFTFTLSLVENFLISLAIGLVIGFTVSYMTKRMRFIAQNVILETSIIFCFAISSYMLSEMADQSGIVSLLITSIIMTHYAWHNLSPQGKHVTSVTFQSVGYGAEVMVFCLVGLQLFPAMTRNQQPIFWGFIWVEMAILVIGRFLSVAISYIIFRPCSKTNENRMSLYQLIYLSYAGLIRGAISFGLMARIDINMLSNSIHQAQLEVSTYILIILTTVIFGTFTPIVQRLCVPHIEEARGITFVNTKQEEDDENDEKDKNKEWAAKVKISSDFNPDFKESVDSEKKMTAAFNYNSTKEVQMDIFTDTQGILENDQGDTFDQAQITEENDNDDKDNKSVNHNRQTFSQSESESTEVKNEQGNMDFQVLDNNKNGKLVKKKLKDSDKKSNSTEYNPFLHPNMLEFADKKSDKPGDLANKFGNPYDSIMFERSSVHKQKKSGCFYFFKELDNKILRPIFIYKYHELVEKQPHYTFGDMLDEYRKIQEELAEAEDNIGIEIMGGGYGEQRPGGQSTNRHSYRYDYLKGTNEIPQAVETKSDRPLSAYNPRDKAGKNQGGLIEKYIQLRQSMKGAPKGPFQFNTDKLTKSHTRPEMAQYAEMERKSSEGSNYKFGQLLVRVREQVTADQQQVGADIQPVEKKRLKSENADVSDINYQHNQQQQQRKKTTY